MCSIVFFSVRPNNKIVYSHLERQNIYIHSKSGITAIMMLVHLFISSQSSCPESLKTIDVQLPVHTAACNTLSGRPQHEQRPMEIINGELSNVWQPCTFTMCQDEQGWYFTLILSVLCCD